MQVNLNDSTTVSAGNTTKNEEWYYRIRVNDGTNYSSWVMSSNVTILNSLSIVSALNIENAGNLYTDDDLVANWTFSDADGDSQAAYYILWYKNGIIQPLLNDSMIVTAGNTSKDQSWSFKLIVNDGTNNSSVDWITAPSSSATPILNTVPEANGLTITTTPYTTDSLAADWNYTDADNDIQSSYLIRWYKNGVLQPSLNDSMTVSSSLTSKGETWNYTLQVSDGDDYSIVYKSTSVTILNSIPTVSGLTITTDPYNTTNLVTGWTFADNDTGDSQADYIIYWYRDGALQSQLDNKTIVEAGNTTKGEVWNYTLLVYDTESWSVAYNSTSTTIINSKPTITGLNIENTGNLYTDSNLVANWTFSDVDEDSQVEFYIWWYKNGIIQTSLNDSKIVNAGNTTKDQAWKFDLVVYDGEDNSSLYSLSPPVQILNTAPTTTGESITSNPNTTSQLEADWTFDDDDTGDVEISYLIRWYKGGILQPALNDSDTVSSSLTSKGEEWNYTLQVFDGEDYSIVYNSSTVTILNLAPTVSGLTITSTPYNTTDLEASWTFVDDDSGDSQTDFYIRWYKDNVIQSSLDNKTTVEAANTTKGEQWNFTLQVFDGENWSVIYNSSITDILNSAPIITGTATFNKTVNVLETDTLNITYVYYDSDLDGEGSAIVYWYKNNASGSYYIQSKDDHTILYSTDTTDGDFWYYILRVIDGFDYSSNYTSIGVSINFVNGKPEALNVQITSDLYTTDDLVGSYVYSDPAENHSEAGTLYAWYWFNSSSGKFKLQHAYNNTLTLPWDATSKGDQWKFSVRPKDGLNYSDSWYNSSAVTILNTLPTASGLILTSNPYNTTNLVANWTFADIDADSQADYYIRWYKDNVLQSQLDNKTTVEAANTTKGEVWNYTLQVQDGEGWSTVYNSDNTTVLNTVPAATDLTLTTNPYTTTDLVADWTFSDPVDSDSQDNYTVRWYKNGELQVDLNDTVTIKAGNTTKGENWKFYLQVHDGDAWSITYISTTVSILNTAPEASNVDLTTSPSTTDDLVADWIPSDVDGDDVVGSGTYLIRWYKGGVLQDILNDSITVAASLTVKGEEWNYTLQVFDGSDHSIVYDSPTITILNSVPTASGLTITSNTYNTTNLIADWVFADNDTADSQVSYEIHWYRDGVVQSQLENKTTVEATNTTKGENWYYTLRVHDGEAYSIYYNSTSVTIQNSEPTATGLNIENAGNIRTTDNLVANWTFNDLDLDNQDGYNISWYKNGILQGDLNDTITVEAGNTTKGENWKFTLQVYDGTVWSTTYTSQIASILNSAPTISSLTFSSLDPKTDEDLSILYIFNDDNGDSESGTQIRWYLNDVLQFNYNNSNTIDSGWIVKGDAWNATIRVSDSNNYSDWLSITTVITNSAPDIVIDSAKIYVPTGGLYTSSTLTAQWAEQDVDGDSITAVNITWSYRVGAGSYNEVPALANNTEVSPFYTAKHQIWRFQIRIFDGTDWSITWYTSETEDILNSEPSVTNITLSGGLTTTDDIILLYDFNDADGDTEITTIDWKIIHGGSVNTVPGTTTLSASEFTAGDLVWAVITPDDGDGLFTGQTMDSSTLPGSDKLILVGDTAPQISLGTPVILADHPDGTQIYISIYSIYVNYTDFVEDIDGTEDTDKVFNVIKENNTDVEYANVTKITGAQYRWYKYNFTSNKWESQVGLTSSFIEPYYLHRDDQWMASIRPRDTYGYYGDWKNSTSIIIGNSLPMVNNILWNENNPTTRDDLSIVYVYVDSDEDPEGLSMIQWYINGVEYTVNQNQTTLSTDLFVKGDTIYVNITPHDGVGYGTSKISTAIMVINSVPEAVNHRIVNGTSLWTNNDLVANWTFNDHDSSDNQTSIIIRWYRNGILEPNLNDSMIVGNGNISRDDDWYFTLQVYDGWNLSVIYTSAEITILNSQMVITSATINDNATTAYADQFLIVNHTFFDLDDDVDYYKNITWHVNGVYIDTHDNETSIDPIYLVKGDEWSYVISIADVSGSWSNVYNSSIILIINSKPRVSEIVFVFDNVGINPINNSREFLIEDEQLNITYTFSDVDADPDDSIIYWYRDGELQNSYTNMTVLPTNITSPGETWKVIIIPHDGVEAGSQVISINITIEGRPVIHEHVIEPLLNNEGTYDFWAETNVANNSITRVEYLISVIALDLTTDVQYAAPNGTTDFWALEDYSILELLEDPADFKDLIGTNLTINVTVITTVTYSSVDYLIKTYFSYTFIIEDNAPPRVELADFSWNDELYPTNVTFYALVQEYGSDIDFVTLLFYFKQVSGEDISNGNGASFSLNGKYYQDISDFTDFNSTEMIFNGTHYVVTVDYTPTQNTEVYFTVRVADQSGNVNGNAYPEGIDLQNVRDKTLRYIIPFNPMDLIPYLVVFVAVVAVLAFVAIRKFSGTELVGLDVEKVMNGAQLFTEEAIKVVIDKHTLGIIVSFFDQRHGPIPIIVEPGLLRDNFGKLVELSDLSFSACRFVNNYDEEISSNFEFIYGSELRTNAIAWAFALERPEARGGSENLTLKILVYKYYSKLVLHFEDYLAEIVHEIHVLMNKSPDKKEEVENKIKELRLLVSSIILSYEKMYGSVEDMEEEL
ncbi:MAG: hypothetical protein ACXAEU_21760 [Candidatus Hodarchaeales archaeon]